MWLKFTLRGHCLCFIDTISILFLLVLFAKGVNKVYDDDNDDIKAFLRHCRLLPQASLPTVA